MSYRYEESSTFHPVVWLAWLFAAAGFVFGLTESRGRPVGLALIVGLLLLALPIFFARLRTRIDDSNLTVEWGWLAWPRQCIPLSEILSARPVTYNPVLQFRGWGMRRGRIDGNKTSVYSTRGTRGVLIELSMERKIALRATKWFLIGTARAEELAAALWR